MREVSVEQMLLNNQYPYIDVRSPIEYNEAHIPGAINIPLFDNEERKEIGTIYKQSGANAAKWRAMEVVAPKIPLMMERIREIGQKGKEPIIYCWRGGMRSKSVALFASMSGLSVLRLEGGYKSYRHYIVEQMTKAGTQLLPDHVIVFHGLTGIGKTELLHHLANRGWPILDLEQLANHRGSVFGDFGHWQAHNQKTFDALLIQRLQELKGANIVLIEAESKRVGKVVLPDFIIEAKNNGVHLLLTADISVRVDNIYSAYVAPYLGTPWLKQKTESAIAVIQKRMSHALRQEIKHALDTEDYKQFIRIILENYYDPMYSHHLDITKDNFTTIDISNLDTGIQYVEAFLHQKLGQASIV